MGQLHNLVFVLLEVALAVLLGEDQLGDEHLEAEGAGDVFLRLSGISQPRFPWFAGVGEPVVFKRVDATLQLRPGHLDVPLTRLVPDELTDNEGVEAAPTGLAVLCLLE